MEATAKGEGHSRSALPHRWWRHRRDPTVLPLVGEGPDQPTLAQPTHTRGMEDPRLTPMVFDGSGVGTWSSSPIRWAHGSERP